MVLGAALIGLTTLLQADAAPPAGIPKALAETRAARVSAVEYDLTYTLVSHAPAIAAKEQLRFTLRDATKPLLLDFRDGRVETLRINGHAATTSVPNGHLVLPAASLRLGSNVVEAAFTANIGAAEKAITRFEDKDDGSEYIYTLFVPMDADMAFPCFDQPDLKARFRLTVNHPSDWTVISNTTADWNLAMGRSGQTIFAPTEPISTYLFAFAAGPFQKVHSMPGLPGLYVRRSKLKAAEAEAPAVQQTAAAGIDYLVRYFNQPFPFPKYDMVLIPGFAFGGMEHAGATFLKEESVLFRTAPTRTNLFNRDILVLHELTHQWFGDFTTMRWFDDLWLKEGFAQYMAYQSLAAQNRPQDGGSETVWKRFFEAIKPAAYAIDQTQGTTPIYQDIPNLKDAKSAYGAIVYQKAPAVIKQLAFVLGAENFRKGLSLYLAQHRYGNARWSDLIQAFESASGKPLGPWAEDWITHRGMPAVDVAWNCEAGKIASFTLSQKDVLHEGHTWPIAAEALLGYPDGTSKTVPYSFSTPSAQLRAAIGQACPAYVFANASDQGYGLFLLDDRSQAYVTAQIATLPSLFERTLLWGSLWASVQNARMAPAEYLALALRSLPGERDEALTASILGHSATALERYIPPATRHQLTPQFAAVAVDRMMHDKDQDLRIVFFRSLASFAEAPAARAGIRALLAGKIAVPGVALRAQDRWRLVTALVSFDDPEAGSLLADEEKRDPTGDGQRFAWIARAAHPDKATKQAYFKEYLRNPERPEDWIEGSLGAFNAWNQAELTGPYLKPALDALGQIKRTRRIFFLVDWLGSFIGGQQTAAAQAEVYSYLKTQTVEPDLRRKILEVEDELDRTVRIRERWE